MNLVVCSRQPQHSERPWFCACYWYTLLPSILLYTHFLLSRHEWSQRSKLVSAHFTRASLRCSLYCVEQPSKKLERFNKKMSSIITDRISYNYGYQAAIQLANANTSLWISHACLCLNKEIGSHIIRRRVCDLRMHAKWQRNKLCHPCDSWYSGHSYFGIGRTLN